MAYSVVVSLCTALLVAALVVVLPIEVSAASACSGVGIKFRFKPIADAGTPSYITEENQNQTINILSRPDPESLPPVIVELFYFDSDTSTFIRDSSLDGKTVTVQTIPSQLRVTGNSVEINQGEALFESLKIYENDPAITYRLSFTVDDPSSVITTQLTTGPVNFIASSDKDSYSRIRFGNSGFFFRREQSQVIPADGTTPLPYFFIEPLTQIGQRRPFASGESFTVTISSSVGSVSPTSKTSNSEGLVEFRDLIYTPAAGEVNPSPVVITFTADNGAGWTYDLVTLPLTAQSRFKGDQFMLFDSSDSHFAVDNIGNTAVKKIRMPTITIQLYSSNMVADPTNNDMIVVASTDQGTLSGGEALFVRGRAVFRDLMFVESSPRSAVITFRARGGEAGSSSANHVLYSGSIEVAETAIGKKLLAFAKGSFVQQDKALTIEKNIDGEFMIPSVIVQVKNSAHQLDPTAGNMGLIISTVEARILSTANAEVINGIARFSDVRFTQTSFDVITDFSVADTTGVRSQLKAGRISLKVKKDPNAELFGCTSASAASDCTVGLKFADSSISYVYEEGQELFTSIDGKIPDIRIQLLNQFESPMSDDALTSPPRLVAFTGELPEQEELLEQGSEGHQGIWRKGEYVFGCLIFKQKPTGLVRLKFRLMGHSHVPDLETGFVTTTETVTSNFGLRFAKEGSLFTYTGQPSSAVVNIALPDIIIEMVDSLHQFDDSNSDVVIVASSSSGELDTDGSREVVKKGRATFATLKFVSIGDEPVLTFMALQSTAQPVAGKSVVTGSLFVTTLPISSFEMVFSPVLNEDNNVTHQFQEFDLAMTSENNIDKSEAITASILVRRSDHRVETVSTDTIVIEVRSLEATIPSAKRTININDQLSANFSTQISDLRAGFDEAYLTYVVTGAYISGDETSGNNNPFLIGQSLTIGPIRLIGSSSETCSTQLDRPTAVAEFKMSVEEFAAQESDMRSRIAYMMGIEVGRVLISNIRAATVVEYDPMSKSSGIKVDITFDKVKPGAGANAKTSAQLNAQFLSIRSSCEEDTTTTTTTTTAATPAPPTAGDGATTTTTQSQGLCFTSVYAKSKDLSCNVGEFVRAKNASVFCALVSSDCQCYAEHIFEQPNGAVCADDIANEDEMFGICQDLTTCRVPSVQGICDRILATRATSMVWLWATLGSVGGLGLILFVLKQQGLLQGKKKATLHSTIDSQY